MDELPVALDFDPTLHSPARLKIMMILAVDATATFNSIAKLAELTPGNLGTHLKSLESAEYLESYRTIVDLKPRVRYRITSRGREALRMYCLAVRAAVQGIEMLVDSHANAGGERPPMAETPATRNAAPE